MKAFLILFISILTCLGCSLADNPAKIKPQENIEIKKSKVNPCDTIPVSLNCIGRTDTIIENKSVKYITKNNFIQVKITIDGIDTLLSDSINCCSQAIPSFRLSKDNFVFLEKGHGFYYREYIMICKKENRLIIKNYETAVHIDLKREVLVYRNTENRRALHFVYYKLQKEKVVFLPTDYEGGEILNAWFKNNKFIVERAGDLKQTEVKGFELE